MFNELTSITATAVVENSRRIANTMVSYISDATVKDLAATTVNLQYGFASIFAEQADKVLDRYKRGFGFNTL